MENGAFIMNKRCSHSVEILPSVLSGYAVGSTKNTSCRISKNGRNIAMPKVSQPNKTGANPNFFKSGSEKWKTLNKEQKNYWDQIAKQENFWSRWTAFMSSFLKSISLNGLDETMNNELSYCYSEARFERQQHLENSIKRNRKYEVDPQHYVETEIMLNQYPIAHDSPLVYVKLLDLNDINNALRCKMAYRTDPIVECEYTPLETGDIEKGFYVKTQRPRVGDEVYELFKLLE